MEKLPSFQFLPYKRMFATSDFKDCLKKQISAQKPVLICFKIQYLRIFYDTKYFLKRLILLKSKPIEGKFKISSFLLASNRMFGLDLKLSLKCFQLSSVVDL